MCRSGCSACSLSSQRVEVLATTFRGRRQMLATSLYDDPAAGLCGDAPAGLDEHPENGLRVLTRVRARASPPNCASAPPLCAAAPPGGWPFVLLGNGYGV